MKLSLSWIFDHIDADWQSQSVENLVTRFNQTTAEIEHIEHRTIPLATFFIVEVQKATLTRGFIPELNSEVKLPERSDNVPHLPSHSSYFLIKRTSHGYDWVTLADFGSEKGGYVPPLALDKSEISGTWRRHFSDYDVILDVDNKSITHRPDMWGHRGFAREIAAFLNLPLKDSSVFLRKVAVERYETSSQSSTTIPFTITNNAPELCRAYNGLYVSSFNNKASHPFLAGRLMMIGNRPVNTIVDITNYLTSDWGQPVHAYDAERIENKQVVIRTAQNKEKLHLLDGDEISLTSDDLIIADKKKPMCLAGVKGGLYDSVSTTTQSLFFEAANFEPTTVRKSALAHKTRTDSSSRFEKTLDPNLALEAVFRFVKLLEEYVPHASYNPCVIALGAEIKPLTIEISHHFIETRSGITITPEEVIKLLTKLKFKVVITQQNPLLYSITVPTFRSSKDISIKEDILEEIIRSYGFNNIPLALPPMQREPFRSSQVQRARTIRTYLAHGIGMMQQQNYALFDKAFIKTLGLAFENTVSIINPISEQHTQLVTTLIPGLLKNITDNIVHQESLAFFEIGKTWQRNKTTVNEAHSVSGIFFNKRNPIDFYLCKNHITQLFQSVGFKKEILWKKGSHPDWYHTHQSATLTYQNQIVGTAGMINPLMLDALGLLSESSAFIFEIDNSFLTNKTLETKKYQSVSRFQETFFDISLHVPFHLTTQKIEEELTPLSPLIIGVNLIDFYEGKQQNDTRSLTFRVWLQHTERTLEKHEIDDVYQKALTTVQIIGATLRT